MNLSRFRDYDPGRSLGRILFFRVCWSVTWVLMTLVYRLRVVHPQRVPRRGALLVVANHQSHLDPPAVGISLRYRHIVPIAKQGLFRIPVFGWLIRMLNSIPINEKEGDAVAIRKGVKELAEGRCILIFPEGSRTPDGRMQPFKRGAWLMISRSKCAVLPAGVEGLYDAWPRSRAYPRIWRRRAAVAFGEVIDHDRLLAMGPDEGLAFLARRIDELRAEAGMVVGDHRSSPGGWNAPPPTDSSTAG
jgi:1-acyl-sn-glycerol-3-phosphate acyltransferase